MNTLQRLHYHIWLPICLFTRLRKNVRSLLSFVPVPHVGFSKLITWIGKAILMYESPVFPRIRCPVSATRTVTKKRIKWLSGLCNEINISMTACNIFSTNLWSHRVTSHALHISITAPAFTRCGNIIQQRQSLFSLVMFLLCRYKWCGNWPCCICQTFTIIPVYTFSFQDFLAVKSTSAYILFSPTQSYLWSYFLHYMDTFTVGWS